MPSRSIALASRTRRQKIAVTDHGLGGSDWGGLLQGLFDRFLVVSHFSARAIRAPAHRTTLIYGGADPNRFKPGFGERRDGVLFVGRITPHKGIDVLVRALPQGCRLSVAGTGGHDRTSPEREYPRYVGGLAAHKDVRFIGPVAEKTLPDLYRSAAVFALPSVHDTCYGSYVKIPELLGLSVLEAMASGTPVVCSRIGGVPEIVEHGVTGYLVEPGDEHELHDRICELISNRRLAERMGRNARESVLATFTWEHCADRCLGSYTELLRRGT
jgi:glycosyltransferase involved in cell wall biosynthesis